MRPGLPFDLKPIEEICCTTMLRNRTDHHDESAAQTRIHFCVSFEARHLKLHRIVESRIVHKAHTKTTMTPCKTEREKKRTSTGCWWFCDVMSNNKAGTAQKTGRKKNTNENYEKLKKSNSEWEIFLVNYLNYFLINCVCWKAHKTFDQLSTLIQNTLTHWQTKWSGEFTITKLLQTDSKN